MKDDVKKQLTQILGAYDDKLAETARAEAVSKAAQAAFPERFVALMKDTIRPTFQEFADVMNSHGHQVEVREQEAESAVKGGATYTTISLHIVPKAFVSKSTDASKSFIEISFSAKRAERKIGVSSTNTMQSSGASIGRRGEYEIEAVTPEVVATHVLGALQEGLVVRGGGVS